MPYPFTRPALLVSLVIATATSSFAWHATGHMIVADIAWKNMNAKARAAAERLVAVDAPAKSPDFITAAVWADDTKTRENGPWHYIDLYFRADGTSTNLKPDAENVVWAIGKFSKVLADRSASEAARGQALRYLLHFVGDIHQPLHCASRVTASEPRGDAGGNRFSIEDPTKVAGRRPHNLHFLWDWGCGAFAEVRRPLSASGRSKIDGYANACLATLSAADKAVAHRVTDPMAWARSGQKLAKDVVYATPEDAAPSAEYVSRGRRVCMRQVAMAGLRLADLLNRLLG
ncbi:MAG: S1/P1 nuclease [Fimbriimonadaceae bacterium]